MQIESGDIVFIEYDVKQRMGNDGNYHWVEDGRYPYGHVEVGFRLDDSRKVRGEELVTYYLNGSGMTSRGLEVARARVYRSKTAPDERTWVGNGVQALSQGTAYSKYRAGTSVLRTNGYMTSQRHRGMMRKYWPRIMELLAATEEAPANVPHVMKNAFCSELAVAAIQVGAMFAVRPGFDEPGDDVPARFAAAQRHPLWLEARAKASTPNDLERLLRSSPHWEYLGRYKHEERDGEDAASARLRAVIHRAIAHYNDRTTLGVFKWTSDATGATLPVLEALANDPSATAANLRFAIRSALGGAVVPAAGRRQQPWAQATEARPLAAGSRLFRCLLLAVDQGASSEFEINAKEVARVRAA